MSTDSQLSSQTSDTVTCEMPVKEWRVSEVIFWATNIKKYPRKIIKRLQEEDIDGAVLLELTENDIKSLNADCSTTIRLGDLKRLWIDIKEIQTLIKGSANLNEFKCSETGGPGSTAMCRFKDAEEPDQQNCCADKIPKEYLKTFIACCYSLLVTLITSFVMVIVHERVPDMQRYPPLPDIILDNIPRIPWAFHCTEITGIVLFIVWTIVCIFHKHRLVLLRRFFALCGSVFLIRCVTMLITSLSVPGSHLECQKIIYYLDDEDVSLFKAFQVRLSWAYRIWSGMGLSIKGIHTCGDYMFSGHTVALTLFNFFITEYTPRDMYYLHTLSWILNLFGVFFILAAHEHYAIDVFIAFYIASRLFLYYHTLANNRAQMFLDRSKIWFPIFYYLEEKVDGSVPNEYDTISSLLISIKNNSMKAIKYLKGHTHQLLIAFINLPVINRLYPGRRQSGPKRESIATSTSFQHRGSLPNEYFRKERHSREKERDSTRGEENLNVNRSSKRKSSL